ncbi:MAG: hypothetical protein JWQ74_1865 [Marmoricola sp.]|nr:hypothetical protein [Marmoricola sp.]
MIDTGTHGPAPIPGTTTRAARHGIGSRLSLWAVLAIVVVHSFAIALWVAPTNLMKNTIGPDRLASYIQPMFDQAWSVFAPEADSQTDMLEIRARVTGTDGRETVTGWTPITEREIVASVRYHPFPSRTVLMSTRLGGYLQRAFNDLSQSQREIIAASGSDVTPGVLERRLSAAALNAQERVRVVSYVRVDNATEQFLSGMAAAVWGKGVMAFQFRKYRIIATQYTHQQGQRQRRLPPELVSNWRTLRPLTAADRGAFGAYAAEFGIKDRS